MKARWLVAAASAVSCLFVGAVSAQSAATPIYELVEYAPPPASPSGKQPVASTPLVAPVALGDTTGTLEVEPNGTSATATPIPAAVAKLTGYVYPAADVDFYSFTASTGDRIYAATQTLFDASASGDSVLTLLASDGSTVIETDNNDGTFTANSASIAGAPIPADGTYYLSVRHNTATGTIRPYTLWFTRQSTAPVAETESNNTPATANALPSSGHVSGTISAVSPGESDFYSIALSAGDSVFLSLDMNPERDASVWNGRLGFGLFGNPPSNQILVINDANAGGTASDPNSEAFFFTVKDAGTYFIYVDSTVATGLGATATYNLSAAVIPRVASAGTCTTYTSTDVPQAIPTVPGQVSSTITVPGNPRIADLDVAINLNHTFMQDIDAHLVSPAGNDNGLFTDIGASTTGGPQTLMDIVLDDEAALPPAFGMSAPFHIQPESTYRLSWFDGEDAGGTWTLVLRDDASGDGGTLNAWSITVCEPPPPPACPAGFVETVAFSTDFESGTAGFTHSGDQDEWELGTPSFTPITTCNSGVSCWKTDLDNTYNASSTQDLLSPNINLAGLSPPVIVTWAQRYHMESANFDHMFIDAREVGGANPVRLFEWLDATMNDPVGNPSVTIAESSGWSVLSRRVDSLAGLNAELLFHVDSDSTVQLTGLAIDDVTVTGCRALSADLAITKTDGVTTAIPGGSVTYTITASNAGPDSVTGATVADTFPASLTCTWTCVGAGGGTCTAAGSGNISDTVNLPAGGSTTYTASCTISAAATGSLSNTATVSSSVTDPNPANNSATDTDTLAPQADLSITKTDGVTTVNAGGNTTYTIVASNAGPSNATGATVADTFPATLTCTWTCGGAGGGTCTGSGSGNISDPVNLPAGGSVTYTAACAISGAATGSLVNTATVAAPGGVTDPTPGNNSATDTDTILPPGSLTITPNSVNFGLVPVGDTSPVQVVTLGNSGGSPLTVTTLTAAAAPFASTGGTCGSTPITIANGASCTLSYTFSPTASGVANQTVTVDAGIAGSGSIALAGQGGAGAIGVSTTSLAFGPVVIGDSTQLTLTLQNTGDGPLQVTGLTGLAAPFAIVGGTCGMPTFTLAAGASCTIVVEFSPTVEGPAAQTLTIATDAGNVTVAVSGEGTVAVEPVYATVDAVSGKLLTALALLLAMAGFIAIRRR